MMCTPKRQTSKSRRGNRSGSLRAIALVIVLLVSGIIACKRPAVHSVGRPLIGTLVTLTVLAESHEKAIIASEAAFSEIARIEALMSPVIGGSDIARINKSASGASVIISPETFALISQSKEIWRETGGAFDITFASMSGLWNFSRVPFVPPGPALLNSMKHLVNMANVELDGKKKTVSLKKPGMKTGLGAIAKGYAIRRAMEVLRRYGIENAMVDAGGDLQVIGSKNGEVWMAGLIHPRTKRIIIGIKMRDGEAVATSGDYERYAMYRGVRYHHIIDPSTGEPARHFASVSVIGRDPVEADAFATAIFVMGMEKARELLARRSGLSAILIDADMKVWASRRLAEDLVVLGDVEITWF